jgi:hypothetical protein
VDGWRNPDVELDLERRLAIAELLAHPDPPELRRGHRLRLEGKPDRYSLVQHLCALFVQKKLIELQDQRAAADMSTERHDIRWVPHGTLREREVLFAA